MPHEVVLSGHFLGGKRQGERHGQGQAFGNRNDDDGDGRDEDTEKILPL
jgi:hypothetical protein